MDFFAHEDRARRATRRLMVLFVLAVVALVAGLDIAAWWVAGIYPELRPNRDVILVWLTIATLFMIAAGSIYKTASLASGGQAVALMLGARPLSPMPSAPSERMLANVVEEMAIASGTPMPRVHVLEEPGLNAFAAGHAPTDAVVVVTRGCLDHLSRDELQGVIAHEFSHLLNGDMRLNLRLIGLLHGILLIALSGRLLMRLGGGGRSSKGNAQIMIAGAALAVIGYAGWLMGQLIKAAMSREREFLADASAVQFTRNPVGIGGALKKLGGGAHLSYIEHENADQFSHLYFATGVKAAAFSLTATHPPLESRIRAIDPAWDGAWAPLGPVAPEPTTTPAPPATAVRSRPFPLPVLLSVPSASLPTTSPQRLSVAAESVAGHIGRLAPEHVAYGAALLAAIPSELAEATRVPFSARAAAIGLLLAAAEERATAQLAEIRGLDPQLAVEVERLRAAIVTLGPSARLPIAGLCIPTLRQLTAEQRDGFLACLGALSEHEPPLAEFVLARLLRVHLAPGPRPSGGIMSVRPLLPALQVILSALAQVGTSDPARAQDAFAAASSRLLDGGETLAMPGERATAANLDRSLDQLASASPGIKRRILIACAWCVSCDGTVTVAEAELLRMIADCLGCPLPPFLDRAS